MGRAIVIGQRADNCLRLRSLPIGSKIELDVGNVSYKWIVVHHGQPSDLYSSEFEKATILLMESIYSKLTASERNNNDYEQSLLHSYLNDSFLSLLDSSIQKNLIQVKIPYRYGDKQGGTVWSGQNGLTTKVWVPSLYELGYTRENHSTVMPVDGSKLSFFLEGGKGSHPDADKLRIAYFDGAPTDWWTRSPRTNANNQFFAVSADAGASASLTTTPRGVRPMIALRSSYKIDLRRV